MMSKQILILAAILTLATLYFYQDPGWNGNSRLDAIRAVVEKGTFQIDSYQDMPEWETMDKSVYNGHYYTDKGIGSSLLALPVYFVLYRTAELFRAALASDFIKHFLTAVIVGGSFVANGVLLYLIGHELTQNSWKAALSALAVSLGTMLWPYSAVYYGHVPAAALLTAAFYLLLPIKKVSETSRLSRLAGAGLAMGLAFVTEYPSGLIILGLLVYALYQVWGLPQKSILRAALAGAVGALLPLALMAVYDVAVYGSVFRFSYSSVAVPDFQTGLEQGFMGIGIPDPKALYHFTFDPRFGIFWQSPVLLLAAVGFCLAVRTKSWRAEALLAAYSIAALFLMNSGYFMWWGGDAFGPRYVIPALSFFVVPLVLLPDGLIPALGGLGIISAGQMLIPLLGQVQIYLNFDRSSGLFQIGQKFHGFSILYQYGLPLIGQMARNGTSPWTMGSAIGLPIGVSAGVLIVLEAALLMALYNETVKLQSRRASG